MTSPLQSKLSRLPLHHVSANGITNTKNSSQQYRPSNFQNSESSITISSKSSAFWPFTQSFEQNNFLSHIISEDSQQQIKPSQKDKFTKDPTLNLFNKLKKAQGSNLFEVNEIVLAKCVNQPLWPAKITQIEKIQGWLPGGYVYHLKFINERSTGLTDQRYLIKFNLQSVNELRKSTENRKLIRALKLAEKYYNQQLEDSQNELTQQTQSKVNPIEAFPIELSLSSTDQLNEQTNTNHPLLTNIDISNKKFATIQNIFRPHQFQKDHQVTENQNKKQNPVEVIQANEQKSQKLRHKSTKKTNSFKPLILIKGSTLEIALNKISQFDEFDKKSEQKDQKLSKNKSQSLPNTKLRHEVRQNHQRQDSGTRKDGKKAISKPKPKPINLVVQTPRLPSEYYLDKVILRLNQEPISEEQDVKHNSNSSKNLDETIMEESNQSKRIICQQKSESVQITKKVTKIKTVRNPTFLPIQFSTKVLRKLSNYLNQIAQDTEDEGLLSFNLRRQRQILEFFSLELPATVKKSNYIEYGKLLQTSAKIIPHLRKHRKYGSFVMKLEKRIKQIYEFLEKYDEQNHLVRRLIQKSLSHLRELFNTGETDRIGFDKRMILSSQECFPEEQTQICQNEETD